MISITDATTGIFRHRRGTLVCWRPMRRGDRNIKALARGLTLIQPEDAETGVGMQLLCSKHWRKTAARSAAAAANR